MRLALIFGGRSAEHNVSVVSARSVASALDSGRYEVVPMAIDREGAWADPETAARVLQSSGDTPDLVMPFKGTLRLDQRLVSGSFDVAFPVLHGPYGEDGTIQGLLEILDIPYVGCGVAASAVCMDKSLTKRLLAQKGLPTAPWVDVDAARWARERIVVEREIVELGFPVFVKPARLGSSIGISRVVRAEDLAVAIEKGLSHDRRLVVEQGIDGREIEVAVLGNDVPEASVPGEVIPGHEFYDYEDKYLDDACELLAPAPLTPAETAEARQLAVTVHATLGCEGMARVDLFLDRETGHFLCNEVNTIPGFTSISMYPRLWELSGLAAPELLDRLVALALERHGGESFR